MGLIGFSGDVKLGTGLAKITDARGL